MTLEVTREDIARLRLFVSQRLGLVFDDSHFDHLAAVLSSRMRSTASGNADDYLQRLSGNFFGEAEIGHLANELTVAETYFFRHPEHFSAFAEVALPQMLDQKRAAGPVKILSAGCASGEEAFSLAIHACERVGRMPAHEVEITAIDASPAMLKKAGRARYSEWSLRATCANRLQRYFDRDGREFVLKEAVRSMVRLENRNIMANDPGFWQPQAFDIIFFRNVAIYFSREAAKSVIDCLVRSLASGGFLFLGPSETLRGVRDDFHLLHTHDTFYYRLKPAGELKSSAAAMVKASPRAPEEIIDAHDQSWVEEVQRAAERVSALSGRHHRSPAAAGSPKDGAPSPLIRNGGDLEPAHELLRQERFDDALAALQMLPADACANLDAMLLDAVILTNKASVSEAEAVCRRILAIDELNAGAHYLLALCREYTGDRAGATEHDLTAVYLDPAFAMPHFHLGMMIKRAGDLTTARDELERALTLLEREDAARILFFGGGFSREALVRLCRAELRTCGGAA